MFKLVYILMILFNIFLIFIFLLQQFLKNQ